MLGFTANVAIGEGLDMGHASGWSENLATLLGASRRASGGNPVLY